MNKNTKPFDVSNPQVVIAGDPSDLRYFLMKLIMCEKDVLPTYIEERGALPTLTDKGVVMSHTPAMLEYLDERFICPSLMPSGLHLRAICREFMASLDSTWVPSLYEIESEGAVSIESRRKLSDILGRIARLVPNSGYMLGESLTIMDLALSAILHKLTMLRLRLPKNKEYSNLLRFQQRMESRDNFLRTLDVEGSHPRILKNAGNG